MKLSRKTSLIKEPNRPEVRLRKLDIVKLGRKLKEIQNLVNKSTDDHRKLIKKTLEQKIIPHKKDMLVKT